MEVGFNVVLFITFVVAALLQGSCAQTTHVVGDALGWIVPPGGDAAYRTWAATTSFRVGDVLVFNFNTGAHDVAEVSRMAYESCNSTSPISISNDGPTRINLTSAGEHHFICTIASHCSLGQRLAINVSLANTYTVGDGLGWTVPPGGPIAYQTWAMTIRSFTVGDTLLFNFMTGAHDVVEVTRAEFDSCNTTTAPITTGPARIPLTLAGEHHYICTVGPHCSLGQRLAINVTAGGSTMTPPSSVTPVTPSPGTASPPGSNSAPSFAIVGSPFTFLTLALAFLV